MDRFLARSRLVARIVAWTVACGIVVLTVVPANERPTLTERWLGEQTGHFIEHFAAFALLGATFAIGYYKFSRDQLLLLALFFAGGIELLQIPLPTRHARVTDFIIDFVTLCVAIVIVRVTARIINAEQRA